MITKGEGKEAHGKHEHRVHSAQTTPQRNCTQRTQTLILILPLLCELLESLRYNPSLPPLMPRRRIGGAAETAVGNTASAMRGTRRTACAGESHEVEPTHTGFGRPLKRPGVCLLPEHCGRSTEKDASTELSIGTMSAFMSGVVTSISSKGARFSKGVQLGKRKQKQWR